MATFIGGKGNLRPYLEMEVDVISQQVENNRSQLRVRLYYKQDSGTIQYSAHYAGAINVDGQNFPFTANVGIYRAGRHLLREQWLWVAHNEDGTKSIDVSGNYNFNLTFNGAWIGNFGVSGRMDLPKIARSSGLKITNTSGQAISIAPVGSVIRFNIDRSNSNYRYTLRSNFYAMDVAIADKISSTTYDWTIPTSWASKFTEATKTWTTFYVDTYNGNQKLGTTQATLDISVPDNAGPTIYSFQAVDLSGQTKQLFGQFAQGRSQIRFDVSAATDYSATIRSYSITFDGQTYSDIRHTFIPQNSGQLPAVVTVTDSRGKTATKTINVNVMAYNPPKIQLFAPARAGGGTNSTVQALLSLKVADIQVGGQFKNQASVKIEYRPKGTASWTLGYSGQLNQASFSTTVTAGTNIDIGKAYDFRLTLTDKISTAISTAEISTAKVVACFSDVGMGIGKIPESGRVLDVGGDTFINGTLYTLKNGQYISISNENSSWAHYNTSAPSGHFFNKNLSVRGDVFAGPNYNEKLMKVSDVQSGSNANGNWVRFPDGTQICYKFGLSLASGWTDYKAAIWTYPVAFSSLPVITGTVHDNQYTDMTISNVSKNTGQIQIRSRNNDYGTGNVLISAMAIGRWK
ncbi:MULTISPECIES: DUF859 family phage minor structural protein [Aerococcus]|uniref:Uncharacterized protein n=1 Tax=Aerococcus tenax TaxID=3078812 RepID=A0A329N6L3_9LACT|nr:MULTISPECIES: DUF859 family phage minor structural protein [Aerococcus]MDL5184725.1 DUF859 family phage minor structural protein [Aerococcus mictus]KAA9239978.1 hypothetical protein F6I34_05635 [Aerococcus urinae]MDK6372001.1 DUF859 family phage minor structural protein [Aerococcus urinae]MDK7302441.1 DUF859 family phage minor structural protein [Aerococcus urinae]MDK7802300.1 DUF859 family phage minor structural protein [Aerococcus urinae]